MSSHFTCMHISNRLIVPDKYIYWHSLSPPYPGLHIPISITYGSMVNHEKVENSINTQLTDLKLYTVLGSRLRSCTVQLHPVECQHIHLHTPPPFSSHF